MASASVVVVGAVEAGDVFAVVSHNIITAANSPAVRMLAAFAAELAILYYSCCPTGTGTAHLRRIPVRLRVN